MLNKKSKAQISFSGVLTILFTLAIVLFMPETDNTGDSQTAQNLILIGVYFVLALSASNFQIVAEIMASLLQINKDDDMNNIDKVLLIRNQLDIYTGLFSSIFTDVREYIKKKKLFRTWQQTKTGFSTLFKGGVSAYQALWISVYAFYLFVIKQNFLNVPRPFNAMVVMGFNIVLALSNRNIKGMGSLIKDLFVFSHKEKPDKITLANIIHTIRLLCLSYSRVAKRIESCTGMTVQKLLDKTGLVIEVPIQEEKDLSPA